MTVPARVSVASLAVADVARSSAVYRALGWPQSSVSRDEIAFFKTVVALLAIYNAEALAAAGVTFPGRSPGGSRQVLLAFHARREEVDGVLQAAQAAGASMLQPAAQGPGGEYPGCFADPDGHLFQVVWTRTSHWGHTGATSCRSRQSSHSPAPGLRESRTDSRGVCPRSRFGCRRSGRIVT
jgi:hypothetical protein